MAPLLPLGKDYFWGQALVVANPSIEKRFVNGSEPKFVRKEAQLWKQKS